MTRHFCPLHGTPPPWARYCIPCDEASKNFDNEIEQPARVEAAAPLPCEFCDTHHPGSPCHQERENLLAERRERGEVWV